MVDRLRSALAGEAPVFVHHEFGPWGLPPLGAGRAIELEWDEGDIEVEPADLVARFPASCPIGIVADRLREVGLALPYGPMLSLDDPGGVDGSWSLATALGLDLPHRLEARFGSWRTWILGARLMLADGTVAKSGSKVVKSVAGYDVHKLVVGARGCLAVLLDVTFRVWPASAIETDGLEPAAKSGRPLWIQRTLATDFDRAREAAGDRLLLADPESSTLWAEVPVGEELRRFPHDYVVRSGCGRANLVIDESVQAGLIRRAKDLFDPERRLNPGCLGVV